MWEVMWGPEAPACEGKVVHKVHRAGHAQSHSVTSWQKEAREEPKGPQHQKHPVREGWQAGTGGRAGQRGGTEGGILISSPYTIPYYESLSLFKYNLFAYISYTNNGSHFDIFVFFFL